MNDVLYPGNVDAKTLGIEAPGGPPTTVMMVVPTITRPGEPFSVKVALADDLGYPSVAFGGVLTLRGAFARPKSIEVTFEEGAPAVAEVPGVTIAEEGFYRFEAQLEGKTFHSNPTNCTADPAHRIYWGDPHVHTVLSDCMTSTCRSLQFCYAAARWFAALDWVSAADHVSNGRCTLGKWMEQRAGCDARNDPPAFVTLSSYEQSLKGGAGGDNNVYFLGELPLFIDEYEEGNTKTLATKLAEALPTDGFFIVPHHTTRTGKHGEIPNDIYPGPGVMPVVEIHSKWGTSEYRGNPNPLEKIHPGPSYVVDLLNQGLPLGFIGGTDTHATMPAGFGIEHLKRNPGMTAVMTHELTREQVFRGIQNRHCYATSLERIYLDVEVGVAQPPSAVQTGNSPGRGRPGHTSMGQVIEWPDAAKSREIRVTAAAKSDITTLDVVRNGETIHSAPVGDWQGSVTFTDEDDLAALALDSPWLGRFVYYYVRVTCVSGAQAWSSPVWLVQP